MGTKKLKPTLPKDEKEIFEKGFQVNISASKRFVTDGHSMILAAAAPDGMLFKDDELYGSKVEVKKIQSFWDNAEKRDKVPAHFIGCGKVVDVFVAVVRDEKGRIAVFNPWILKFALMASQADAFAISPSIQYWQDFMVLLREGKLVGSIMPMRYGEIDLMAYDLAVPAVPLSEV